MRWSSLWILALASGMGWLGMADARSQQPKARPAPKLEPVADTHLLMEALADTNFKGLTRLLKDRPREAEAWKFAKGQALVIAETGNLLMLRQPKGKESQDLWMARAAEMRDVAAILGKAAADKDYIKARAGLADLANACNHCHKSFQVKQRAVPFPDE